MATAISEQDYIKRIAALERQCATLAAQVDRMRLVVDAAQRWTRDDKGFLRIHLRTAVINYEQQMTQLTKDGG
jgi:hypothetical protein